MYAIYNVCEKKRTVHTTKEFFVVSLKGFGILNVVAVDLLSYFRIHLLRGNILH